MLTRLKLRNFKSWTDSGNVSLRPITGLFGANGSGKTSLLQALVLLKQTSDSADRSVVFHFGDQTTAVKLGDFRSVVHGHDTGKEIRMGLDWEVVKPFRVVDTKRGNRTVLSDRRLGFAVAAHQSSGVRRRRFIVREMSYRVGRAGFGMRRRATKEKVEYELFAEETSFSFIRSVGRPWQLPAPVKAYGFPGQVDVYFQNAGFLAELQRAFEQRLRRIHYLGPLRADPKRRYTWMGAQPIGVGKKGEFVVDAILASRERGATIGRGNQVFQVKVRKTPGSPEVLITDVGFGLSQILPVLVLCFYVSKGSTIILEHPELHLHPAVQAGLADLLVEAWRKRQVQVLFESHSEHLLHRLHRWCVVEERAKRDEIGIFFCRTERDFSRLAKLDLDLFGKIANWPKDFFGDGGDQVPTILSATQEGYDSFPE